MATQTATNVTQELEFIPSCKKCKHKKTYLKSFGDETTIRHVYLCCKTFCDDTEVSLVKGLDEEKRAA